MRTAARRTILLAIMLLVALIVATLAWAFGIPPARHLYYAVLPTADQNLAARLAVNVSRLSLSRLDYCPTDTTWPDTPIGFLVAAVHNEADKDWFPAVLSSLVRVGCDVNAYNQAGLTPLMSSALFGHQWVGPVLLSSGANPGLRSKSVGRSNGLSAAEIAERSR